MTLKTILFAAALSLPTVAQANFLDFIPDPQLRVNAVDSDSFEVVQRRGAGAPDMWCAAARYANDTLGVRKGRIWVETPRGPARSAAGYKGVIFTTAPQENGFTALSAGVSKAGQSYLVGHARQFCDRYSTKIF